MKCEGCGADVPLALPCMKHCGKKLCPKCKLEHMTKYYKSPQALEDQKAAIAGVKIRIERLKEKRQAQAKQIKDLRAEKAKRRKAGAKKRELESYDKLIKPLVASNRSADRALEEFEGDLAEIEAGIRLAEHVRGLRK